MDPSVVASDQFGIMWKTKLLGKYHDLREEIFAQPLVFTPKDKQYVYVVSTQNVAYKIDAKTGDILAHRTLAIPFLEADLDGCTDINPLIGSTGTGVIDPEMNSWSFTLKTYQDQTDQEKGRLNGRYWIYSLDVETLADRPNFPVPLEGLVARNNPNRMFKSGNQHQRPALLHQGNFIYSGYASHCVQYNFSGYIIGWHKDTGKIVEVYTTQAGPENNQVKGGGIWMGGGGITADDKGSIWLATGNGYASQLHGTPLPGRQPPTALEEAAIHLTINPDGTLNLIDFFMPWEKEQLDGADRDLGTSPLELLPKQFSCPNQKRLGVVTGKSGRTYFLNMDNLGGYTMGPNKGDAAVEVFQHENSVYGGAGVYPLEGGYVYINVVRYPTRVFKFGCNEKGDATFVSTAQTNEKSAWILGVGQGTTTSLNDQPGTGLFWVTDVQGYNLRIYKAVPQNGVLEPVKLFTIPGTTKFTRPVFGNGMAYIGTGQNYLYAVGSPVNPPLSCSGPYDFGPVYLGRSSVMKAITCQANIDTSVTKIEAGRAANFKLGNLPGLPIDLPKGTNVTFHAAFAPNQPGPLSNDVLLTMNNKEEGFAGSTPVTLHGTGDSYGPLLNVNPNTVSFKGVITGQQAGGVTESFTIANLGDNPLNIRHYAFSINQENGVPANPVRTAAGSQIGPFVFQQLPNQIAPRSEAVIAVNFDPKQSGSYAVYLNVTTDGGSTTVDFSGTSGTWPKGLVEFEKPDRSGYVPFRSGAPFSFGDVSEGTTLPLKMRISNVGGKYASALSITVSKPPVGATGIVGAQNSVDLGEGTSIGPGLSENATLFCSVPRRQVNTPPANGTAKWQLNMADPSFSHQDVYFNCNGIAEQYGPKDDQGQGYYRYLGCARENNPERQLEKEILADDKMTNGMCLDACYKAGYIFAGTQYSRECWCGNRMPKQIDSESQCNYNCVGNGNETCGGNGYFHNGAYISLFADNRKWANSTGYINGAGADLPTKPAQDNAPAKRKQQPPSNAVNPGNQLFAYLGCYAEPGKGRALKLQKAASGNMTIDTCLGACSGSVYAGVEYGKECWCGSSLNTLSVKSPDEECTLSCSGDDSETCGGPKRITLYKKRFGSTSGPSNAASGSIQPQAPVPPTVVRPPPGAPIKPAYPPIQNSPARPVPPPIVGPPRTSTLPYRPPPVQPQQPVQQDEGFDDEDGGLDPALGNSAPVGQPAYPQPAPRPAQVQYPPPRPQSPQQLQYPQQIQYPPRPQYPQQQQFGQPQFGQEYDQPIYEQQPQYIQPQAGARNGQGAPFSGWPLVNGVPQFPGAKDRHLHKALKRSKDVAAAPTQVASVGKFVSKGCYHEPSAGRALKDKALFNDAMTVAICAEGCADYKYFGVEYGRECYCGNTLNEGSVLTVKQEDCSFACPGDKSQLCGAGQRLSLYAKSDDSAAAPSAATPSAAAPPAAASPAAASPAAASPAAASPAAASPVADPPVVSPPAAVPPTISPPASPASGASVDNNSMPPPVALSTPAPAPPTDTPAAASPVSTAETPIVASPQPASPTTANSSPAASFVEPPPGVTGPAQTSTGAVSTAASFDQAPSSAVNNGVLPPEGVTGPPVLPISPAQTTTASAVNDQAPPPPFEISRSSDANPIVTPPPEQLPVPPTPATVISDNQFPQGNFGSFTTARPPIDFGPPFATRPPYVGSGYTTARPPVVLGPRPPRPVSNGGYGYATRRPPISFNPDSAEPSAILLPPAPVSTWEPLPPPPVDFGADLTNTGPPLIIPAPPTIVPLAPGQPSPTQVDGQFPPAGSDDGSQGQDTLTDQDPNQAQSPVTDPNEVPGQDGQLPPQEYPLQQSSQQQFPGQSVNPNYPPRGLPPQVGFLPPTPGRPQPYPVTYVPRPRPRYPPGSVYPNGLPRPVYPGRRPVYPGERPIYPGERPIYPGRRPIYSDARPYYPGARPYYPGRPYPPAGFGAYPAGYPFKDHQLDRETYETPDHQPLKRDSPLADNREDYHVDQYVNIPKDDVFGTILTGDLQSSDAQRRPLEDISANPAIIQGHGKPKLLPNPSAHASFPSKIASVNPKQGSIRNRGVAEAAPTPTALAAIEDFTYVGCYTEAYNKRTFSDKAIFHDNMTIAICHAGCSDFAYFGVEYGRECWCGGQINNGSTKAIKESECSFPCPGDKTSACGGSVRLSTYFNAANVGKKPLASVPVITPAANDAGPKQAQPPATAAPPIAAPPVIAPPVLPPPVVAPPIAAPVPPKPVYPPSVPPRLGVPPPPPVRPGQPPARQYPPFQQAGPPTRQYPPPAQQAIQPKQLPPTQQTGEDDIERRTEKVCHTECLAPT
jgi:hypothetical protein